MTHRKTFKFVPGLVLAGSIATATWAMLAGASMVRVHDVPSALAAATLVGTTRVEVGGPCPVGTGRWDGG